MSVEALAGKAEGMDRAESAANPEWKREMYACILQVARTHSQFTSDDVFIIAAQKPFMPRTHELRAFGPLMMRAAKAGVCKKANVAAVNSNRVSLHASPRAVWDSLIFGTHTSGASDGRVV